MGVCSVMTINIGWVKGNQRNEGNRYGMEIMQVMYVNLGGSCVTEKVRAWFILSVCNWVVVE